MNYMIFVFLAMDTFELWDVWFPDGIEEDESVSLFTL